jgi:hypothetical protein
VIDTMGLLDGSLSYCMDYEYWLRVAALTPFVRVPCKLAGSRLHPTTKTLGSRVAVHAEINDMLKRTLGRVPTRWLYNYAFAVYDAHGWDRRDLHRHTLVFSLAMATAFLRWRRTVPLSLFQTLATWYMNSWQAASDGKVSR